MRIRHSTIVSYLALFVALGGTSYAAVTLKANSVGSAQIKPNAVHLSDMASSARPPSRAGLVGAIRDVVTDPGTNLNITVHGEKGDAGVIGPAGPAGAPGLNTITRVEQSVSTDPADGNSASLTIGCPTGMVALNGGLDERGTSPTIAISDSAPSASGAGWDITFYAVTGVLPNPVAGWALCVPGSVG